MSEEKKLQEKKLLNLISNAFYDIISKHSETSTLSELELNILNIESKEDILKYANELGEGKENKLNIFAYIDLQKEVHKKAYDTYTKIYSLPQFKYNPNAYLHEVNKFEYEPSFIKCDVCDELTNYYIDNMYSAEYDEEPICPKCIVNGSAAHKYDGFFIDEDTIKYEELTLRTPTYVSFQEEEWLFCCDEPMIYIGEKTYEELEIISYESNFDEDLIKNANSIKHLFECEICSKYKVHVDFD